MNLRQKLTYCMTILGKHSFAEIMRYVMVGGLGLVVDFGSFWLFTSSGISVLISQWIAASLGFAHNHVWHHFWVFDHSQTLQKTSMRSLALSLASIVVSGPLTTGLFFFLHNVWLSKIVALGLLTVLLYVLRKIWIFTKEAPVALDDRAKSIHD